MNPVPALTDGQQRAREALRRIASQGPELAVVSDWQSGEALFVDVSVDCSNLRPADGGLRLRPRERLVIRVPPGFPFDIPTVFTWHRRWAGTPHVQWGRHLCLYVSPATEWDPSDGMAGFVERLMLWLERAAAGELDAPGEPLHPPVAYPSADAGLVVVRANAPRVSDGKPWLGIALLRRVSDDRADLIGWRGLAERWPLTDDEARLAAGPDAEGGSLVLAFAVFLPRPISFEYPDTAAALVESLALYGVDSEVMLGMLGATAAINRHLDGPDSAEDDEGVAPPLYLVVGTPARGVVGTSERMTHIAVWQLPPLGEEIARLVPKQHSEIPEMAELGRAILKIGQRWLAAAKTSWAQVYEARQEIVTARDAGTPGSWLVGRRVLVLGAGALGAPVAEACVRGGASDVAIADRGKVHPGVLVRQPYEDADIGQPKAMVLAERLGRIRPGAVAEPSVVDIVTTMFQDGSPAPAFDLVIDATADRTVRILIERHRAAQRDGWPPLVTVLVGHDARRGIVTVSHAGSTGAGADVLRRLSLAARAGATGGLADVVDDFFPDPPRGDLFQPEPGCSDVTFVGSAAEVAGLAGQLLAGALGALAKGPGRNTAMLALVVRTPQSPGADGETVSRWLTWPNDIVLWTAAGGYEVRLAAPAVAEMRAEARRGARVRTDRVETGGTLLGAIDAAVGAVWVDEATGPPPDSRLSEEHFDHGTEGVEERIAARRSATARVTSFVGMWHSHPFCRAWPSERDEAGMQALVLPLPSAPPRALLLIAGGTEDRWRSWVAGGMTPEWYARVVDGVPPSRGASLNTALAPIRRGVRVWPGGLTSPEAPARLARRSRMLSWLTRWRGESGR